jgi:sec-independent protein translocase protein TatA
MGGLSPAHWLIVLVVVLLLFGAGRLADIGKGLGEGIKNFKKGLNDDGSDDPQKKDPKLLAGGKDAPVGDPIDEESKKRA